MKKSSTIHVHQINCYLDSSVFVSVYCSEKISTLECHHNICPKSLGNLDGVFYYIVGRWVSQYSNQNSKAVYVSSDECKLLDKVDNVVLRCSFFRGERIWFQQTSLEKGLKNQALLPLQSKVCKVEQNLMNPSGHGLHEPDSFASKRMSTQGSLCQLHLSDDNCSPLVVLWSCTSLFCPG